MRRGGVIGQYRVTGLLGYGGMGAVYAAEHVVLGRSAAVKVLLPKFSRNQELVTRFFNEARATAAVHHPGIVEIYDFGWHTNGAAYIVMERLEGESLSVRAAAKPMPWSRALAIGRQIAGVLTATHAKGIVHRDLKTDNVFLEPDSEVPGRERVKLIDFGIAKLLDDAGNEHETRAGVILGTPSYMAPEQCRGVAVDHRADLYSLGCILFKLCTGRAPFAGEGSGDVLAAHIHVPAPMMGSLISGIPAGVDQLVQRLLAKRPDDRVQSADELVNDIDVVMGAAQESSGQLLEVPSTPRPAATPLITTLSGAAGATALGPRDNRRMLFGVGGASIALVLAIYIVRSGHDQSQPVAPATEDELGHANLPAPPTALEPVASPVTPTLPEPLPVASPVTPTLPARPPVASPITPTLPAPAMVPVATAPDEPPKDTEAPPPPTPPRTVEVVIETMPSGADVVRSGKVLGKTPFRGELPYGEHDLTLVVRLQGYVDKTIVARSTKPFKQQVQLVARPKPYTPRNRDYFVNPFNH